MRTRHERSKGFGLESTGGQTSQIEGDTDSDVVAIAISTCGAEIVLDARLEGYVRQGGLESKPSIETLIKKFSDQTPPPQPVDHGKRPSSTMEPSAESQDQGSVCSNILDGGLSPKSTVLHPSGSRSQESALPSGDTELAVGRGSASVHSSRSRRPRVVRPPHKILELASQSLLSPDGELHSSVIEDPDGTSVAFYGDLFTDGKDRILASETSVGKQGDGRGEAFRGDTSGKPSADGSAAMNAISTSGSDPEKFKQLAKALTSRDLEVTSTTFKSGATAMGTDGQDVRVGKRSLDGFTPELVAARDDISRKELRIIFTETHRLEQQEILLLERQDSESVVEAVKTILAEHEQKLKEALSMLSATTKNVPMQDRSSQASKPSIGGVGENLNQPM
ncbi:hypothetical protein FGB62_110g17 [Gracilaria domingensis]|nr:hypothetical protein FGB62_335g09 [Gracilaria domingensis]KAI0560543.1 hypothetical protein FGB62_110g17 [Gracilaria domingensis]